MTITSSDYVIADIPCMAGQAVRLGQYVVFDASAFPDTTRCLLPTVGSTFTKGLGVVAYDAAAGKGTGVRKRFFACPALASGNFAAGTPLTVDTTAARLGSLRAAARGEVVVGTSINAGVDGQLFLMTLDP